MRPWLTHLDKHRDSARDALFELLRIPSVSADPAHREDCARAAELLLGRLKELGFDGRLARVGEGQPIVAAKFVADDTAPTVTLYGHYDVQPPDPVENWTTPPFEPTVVDGTVRARGATDDKGQLMANLVAVEAHVKAQTLDVNVQVLIEGEEESGGRSLEEYIAQYKDDLACKAVLVSDTALFDDKHPAICHGLRGIATMEVRVTGPSHDLHSGIYGGAVVNPNEALARAIATLKDADGRVKVPGFYDAVRKLSAEEKALLAGIPFDERHFRDETGAPQLGGEKGSSALERMWVRPTLEINGLSGGYAGPGFKTVLPAQAVAKVSCRLVPDMDPQQTADAVLGAIRKALPPQVKAETELYGMAAAWYVSPNEPVLQTAAECLEKAFGGKCLFIREGGSIPVVPHLERLGPVVLMGYGMHDERLHAPDEFFRLDNFHKGSVAMGWMLDALGRPSTC